MTGKDNQAGLATLGLHEQVQVAENLRCVRILTGAYQGRCYEQFPVGHIELDAHVGHLLIPGGQVPDHGARGRFQDLMRHQLPHVVVPNVVGPLHAEKPSSRGFVFLLAP